VKLVFTNSSALLSVLGLTCAFFTAGKEVCPGLRSLETAGTEENQKCVLEADLKDVAT
jgi:hypothetical protein